MARYEVHRLGRDYYGVWDARTELYVATRSSQKDADSRAAKLNDAERKP